MDGDEAGHVGRWQSGADDRFGGRMAQASTPGIEGGGGHALLGAEGHGGQAGAFKPQEALPPEILKGAVGAAAKTRRRGCRHEASPENRASLEPTTHVNDVIRRAVTPFWGQSVESLEGWSEELSLGQL